MIKNITVTRLSAISCVLMAAAQGKFIFEEEVTPIISTQWGQEYPYNRMCPTVVIDSTEKHRYAGCGPLVMSQVVCHDRKQPLPTASRTTYRWELMDAQLGDTSAIDHINAVARLIRDCGTAAETNYGQTASSTKLNNVVQGLKKHFGYNRYMHIADRAYYRGKAGDKAWKQLIADELKAGRPIIIRGEKSKWNAHVFIIDGCRDSLVHVNWGWNGRRNGYYDPDSLYGFNANQRMVVGIAPKSITPAMRIINVDKPGRLAHYINEDDWLKMRHVKLTGTINKNDIKLLRQLAGGAPRGSERNGTLSSIDMSECVILALPDSAFCNCDNLTSIILPITLPEISAYAFAGCTKLNNVTIQPLVCDIRQRAFSGCFNLMYVTLPRSLVAIGANAFNSCNALTSVAVPQTVKTIGNGAFAYARNLRELTIPKTAIYTAGSIAKGTKVKQIKKI